MSYDDDHRGNPQQPRERGAYTPPTDDDLMFERRGGYDNRRGGPAQKSPPITLIVSAIVLLLLIVAVVMFYRSGVRSSTDAPAVVGTPVDSMKVEAPLDAQPIDPEEGVRVYRDGGEASTDNPTFTPGPEAVAPRPEPREVPVPAPAVLPAAPAPKPAPAPVTPAPAPKATPAPAPRPEPAPVAATGNSAVQIGAFSSQAIADREYAAVAGRFGQFASGATKRVQEVQTANGSTLYRTTFTGLSRERAQAFCNALKAAGKDCLVR